MRLPRVLFYDVETSYFKVNTFRIGNKISIGHDQIMPGSFTDIICVCWKWSDEKEIHSLDWGLHKQNSKKLISAFTKEIEKADLVVAHNGDHFDRRQINTQRLLNGLPPIAWPTSEDTLKQLRKEFYLPSYRLDYLGKLLCQTGKINTSFQNWVDVIDKKDDKALRTMIKYCKRDVLLLERVYNKVKEYLVPKINAGLLMYGKRFACPRCGSEDISRYGVRSTLARKYQRLHCDTCGTVYKGPRIKE